MNEPTVPSDTEEEPKGADAGRGPTTEEEQAAERVAPEVDLDQVRRHEQEMTKLGANVKGEGQVG